MKALSLVGVRSAKASRKARNRRFVPESPAGQSTARLEGRALAAPAFYRYPYGDYREANDNTWSTGPGGINVGEFSSSADLHLVINPTNSYTGEVSTFITDVGDPAPPNSPVGAETISMGAAADLNWTGDMVTTNGDEAQFGGARNYQIAHNGSGSGTGWSVFETLQVNYSGPTSAELIRSMTIGVQLNFNTPGMTVTLQGGGGNNNYGFTGFNIDGLAGTAGQGGSFTTAGGTQVTYATSGASAFFTARTPLGAIPGATTNPVGGIGWGVNFNGHMGFSAKFLVPGTTTMKQNFSMSYGAAFSNV